MLFRLVSFAAVALLSAAAAHPADGQESTEVGLPVFPEFAGLGLLDDLAEGDAFDSDMDDDGDGEDEGIEARAANQCTMAKLKEIMFDWSITKFEDARNKKSPSCFIWKSDQCTGVWDKPRGYNFIPSCHRHDFGDSNLKARDQWNPVMKFRTDWRFNLDMLDECAKYDGWRNVGKRATCTFLAGLYYAGVVSLNPPIDL